VSAPVPTDAAADRALAVVVVTHNSADVLGSTLAALKPQLRDDDELIVVDCASTDGGVEMLVEENGGRLLALDENLGFAGGAVVGALQTRSPLLFFLNPDARPARGCLDALRAIADERPAWGAWQALVTLPGGDRVNTNGGMTHFLGFGWAGGHDQPVHADAVPSEVSFASGAAMVVRRDAWESAGGFDPAYFMYGEDLDLSLRLRLGGHGVGIAPAARVEHDYRFEKGSYKWLHLERNRAWTVLSDYPAPLLALLAPALLTFEFALWFVAARDGWLPAKLDAQRAVLRELPGIVRRRRRVQRNRTVSAADFAQALTASLDSPFLSSPRALVWLQAHYWAAVQTMLRTAWPTGTL
jgi:GT2 family glycosyltransferase